QAVELPRSCRPVRPARQPDDLARGVAGQLLPRAVDPHQLQLAAEPERRLARLLEELIDPGARNAGRRHGGDRLTCPGGTGRPGPPLTPPAGVTTGSPRRF